MKQGVDDRPVTGPLASTDSATITQRHQTGQAHSMTGSAIILYGIKNCDTVRKARRWLDSRGIAYEYHDFREQGLDLATVSGWLERLPSDQLLNRRGTTWRQLDDETRNQLSEARIPDLLVANPTLIKRPVLDTGAHLTCGFDDKTWQQLFN